MQEKKFISFLAIDTRYYTEFRACRVKYCTLQLQFHVFACQNVV
jgi:hypothetical protein